VRWICVAVLRLACDPFCRRRDDGPGFHWKRRDSVGPTGTCQYSIRFLPKIPTPQGKIPTGKHTHTAVSEWPRPCSAAHCSPRSSPAAPGRPGPPPGSVSGDVGPRLLRARCLPTPPNPSPPPPLPPAATAPRRSRLSCRSSRSSR
jgi:hypothetical protein